MLKGGGDMKKIKKSHKVAIIFLIIVIVVVFFILILNKVTYKTNVYHNMKGFSEERSTLAKFLSPWYFFTEIDERDLQKLKENNNGDFKIGIDRRTIIHKQNNKTTLYIPYLTGNLAMKDPKVLFVKVKNNIAYIYIDKPREGTATMIDNWIIEVTISKEVNDAVVVNLF